MPGESQKEFRDLIEHMRSQIEESKNLPSASDQWKKISIELIWDVLGNTLLWNLLIPKILNKIEIPKFWDFNGKYGALQKILDTLKKCLDTLKKCQFIKDIPSECIDSLSGCGCNIQDCKTVEEIIVLVTNVTALITNAITELLKRAFEAVKALLSTIAAGLAYALEYKVEYFWSCV